MFGPLVNQKWSYFWDQNISTLISTQLLSKVSVIKRPSWEHINIKIQRQQEPNSELCVLVGQRAAVLIVWRTNTKTDCWWWRCLRTNFHRSAHSVCCWDVCPHSIKSLKMFKELNCFSCSGSYWFQFRFPFSASSSLSINMWRPVTKLQKSDFGDKRETVQLLDVWIARGGKISHLLLFYLLYLWKKTHTHTKLMFSFKRRLPTVTDRSQTFIEKPQHRAVDIWWM